MRGALDVYTRFVSWQADRRAYRQLNAAGVASGQAPQFQGYFDPSVDIVAAVVHGAMGAGAAVLFGTTGQISGSYAALVVGLSAPMLLTQLGRIQSVNEAVTGDPQTAGATEEPGATGAPATVDAVGGGSAGDAGARRESDAAAAVSPYASPPARTNPAPEPAEGALPASAQDSPARARPMPTARAPAPAPVADARMPEGASSDVDADRTQLPNPTGPGDTPAVPADPADGTRPGFDAPSARRWQQGPTIGEEGV